MPSKKLEKRIIRLTAQAITDFGMIEDGDRVMVAMSGGKDSFVLLDALRTLQKRAPIKFDLVAVNVDQHIPNFPREALEQYFKDIDVEYHIEDQDTYSIILVSCCCIMYFVFNMLVTVISRQNKLRWLPRNGIWNGKLMNAS